MSRALASLSLDLDNLWSYLQIHGDPGWEERPSYLDLLVPRALDVLSRHGLRITFFVVGQDAALPENAAAFRALGASGHDVGSHSFGHEPWMLAWDEDQVDRELARAEDAIEGATGIRPCGFRGPGFALSEAMLNVLLRRGYLYDASTFPSVLGPLARAFYFATAKLPEEEKRVRATLFGSAREGLRPLAPYLWKLREGHLVEIPVTTLPLLRVPIHVSYVMYLARRSEALALAYFRSAVAVARATGTPVSLLLHPLDLLGGDDVEALRFFPAMDVPAETKLRVLDGVLATLSRSFRVVTMEEHARSVLSRTEIAEHRPRFRALPAGVREAILARATAS